MVLEMTALAPFFIELSAVREAWDTGNDSFSFIYFLLLVEKAQS